MRGFVIITLNAVCLVLAGCETPKQEIEQVNIVSSDMCRIQPDKLTWDVKDTPDTITGIRRFNAKLDSRCRSRSKSTS